MGRGLLKAVGVARFLENEDDDEDENEAPREGRSDRPL
jgi:hypothetical protein